MIFRLKLFDTVINDFIKTKNRKNKRKKHVTFNWLRCANYLKRYKFILWNNKKKRIVKWNQVTIGLSCYYPIYNNKNATFRARLEKKKKEKEKKNAEKEKLKKKKKVSWKEKRKEQYRLGAEVKSKHRLIKPNIRGLLRSMHGLSRIPVGS